MISPTSQPVLPPSIECRCQGDPRQMGLTQGTALRQKIRQAHQSLRHLEALRLEQPWWLPYRLFLNLAERKSETSFASALRRSNSAMLARLQGIAEGAGLPLRALCLMNALEAFIASLDGRTRGAPLGACSALAVRGASSRTGEPIIARNFDYLPLLQPFYMLRESRPSGGYRSVDFAVAPQAGTVDGLNEKGLAITLNYAFVTDPGTPNSLITMLIADALASCATVTDAVHRISATPRWGAGILMLADASGDQLAAIMGDHGAGGIADGASPCVHTRYFNTTASLQWFPARRRARVSFSSACTAQYVEIAL